MLPLLSYYVIVCILVGVCVFSSGLVDVLFGTLVFNEVEDRVLLMSVLGCFYFLTSICEENICEDCGSSSLVLEWMPQPSLGSGLLFSLLLVVS